MTEYNFIHFVFLEKGSKGVSLLLYVEGRIMYHGEKKIPFFPDFTRHIERERKAHALAPVQLKILLGIIRAAGARPAPRTRDNKIFYFYAVVLKKYKRLVGARSREGA